MNRWLCLAELALSFPLPFLTVTISGESFNLKYPASFDAASRAGTVVSVRSAWRNSRWLCTSMVWLQTAMLPSLRWKFASQLAVTQSQSALSAEKPTSRVMSSYLTEPMFFRVKRSGPFSLITSAVAPDLDPGRLLRAAIQHRDGRLGEQRLEELPLSLRLELLGAGQHRTAPARMLHLPGLRDPVEDRVSHREPDLQLELLVTERSEMLLDHLARPGRLRDHVGGDRPSGDLPQDPAARPLQDQGGDPCRARLDPRRRIGRGHERVPPVRRARS